METPKATNMSIPEKERMDFFCAEAMKGLVRVVDRQVNNEWIVDKSLALGEAMMAGVDARHAEIVAATGEKKGGKGK